MNRAGVSIRRATKNDLPGIESLLRSGELPTLGVAEHVGTFLIAEEKGTLVGAIGLEVYGDTGLLRSAVVDIPHRNSGVGSLLYESLLSMARSFEVRKLVLLTNTAEEYFGKKGFRLVDRSSVTGPVTRSVEFGDACPEHSAIMEMSL